MHGRDLLLINAVAMLAAFITIVWLPRPLGLYAQFISVAVGVCAVTIYCVQRIRDAWRQRAVLRRRQEAREMQLRRLLEPSSGAD